MSDAPAPRKRPDFISPEGEVCASIPCTKCRYDLKGLKVTNNCPECATPVIASIPHGNLLSPDQMTRIYSSLTVIIACSCCFFASLFMLVFHESTPRAVMSGIMLILCVAAAARTRAHFRLSRADILPQTMTKTPDHSSTLRFVSSLSTALWGIATIAISIVPFLRAAGDRETAHNGGFALAVSSILFGGICGVIMLSFARRTADLMDADDLKSVLTTASFTCFVLGTLGSLLMCVGPVIGWLVYIGALSLLRHELIRQRPS